jgi:hypothetical protein
MNVNEIVNSIDFLNFFSKVLVGKIVSYRDNLTISLSGARVFRCFVYYNLHFFNEVLCHVMSCSINTL